MDTEDLDTFMLVARALSFSRAAEQLGVPRSTLSRRVHRLEAELGQRLLERDTRNVRLSEAGRLLLERGGDWLQDLSELRQDLQELEQTPVGVLRVATPIGLARGDLLSFLMGFRGAYPRLRLCLIETDLPLAQLETDFDIVIRAGLPPGSDWIARRIAPADERIVAAPGYLAAHGTPGSVAALQEHALLGVAGVHDVVRWPLTAGGQLRVEPALVSNDMELVRQAVVEGAGLALMQTSPLRRELHEGSLVTVLAEQVGRRRDLFALYPPARRRSAAVRAYFSALDQYLSDNPPLPDASARPDRKRGKQSAGDPPKV